MNILNSLLCRWIINCQATLVSAFPPPSGLTADSNIVTADSTLFTADSF